MLINSEEYIELLDTVRQKIKSAQYRAMSQANTLMLLLYYDIGVAINEHKTWGSKFIDNLARDIKHSFPASKGYSVRNLKYMAKFASCYPDKEFVQQVVAQIPWGHNIVLLDKINSAAEREWYWGRGLLSSVISTI